jgi:hypothetical protein
LIDGDSYCRKRLPPLSDNEDDDDDDVNDTTDNEDYSDGERHEMRKIRVKRRDSETFIEAVASV